MEVPAALAVKTPSALTEATVGLLLLHVPPTAASVKAVVLPTQIGLIPIVGGRGVGLTVIVIVAMLESTT